MAAQVDTIVRNTVLVERRIRPMMGIEVLEPVPARNVSHELSDLHHNPPGHGADQPGTKLDTTHPHRGFKPLASSPVRHRPQHRSRRDVQAGSTRAAPAQSTPGVAFTTPNIGADSFAREDRRISQRPVLGEPGPQREQSEPTLRSSGAGRTDPPR